MFPPVIDPAALAIDSVSAWIVSKSSFVPSAICAALPRLTLSFAPTSIEMLPLKLPSSAPFTAMEPPLPVAVRLIAPLADDAADTVTPAFSVTLPPLPLAAAVNDPPFVVTLAATTIDPALDDRLTLSGAVPADTGLLSATLLPVPEALSDKLDALVAVSVKVAP